MGKIHYEFPVKCVHGKISKSDKISFAKKTATGTTYGVKRDDWTMHYKTAEKAQAARLRQNKFKSVALAASERLADSTKQAADKAAFAAQSKYKTLWGYVFAAEWEEYGG